MKLKSIHIDSYRHLENLDFDFTYPEGHARAGQPLEKICIIGQSATGKTGILELILNESEFLKGVGVVDGKYISQHSSFFNSANTLEFLTKNCNLRLEQNKIIKGDNTYEYIKEAFSGESENLIDNEIKLIYLSSEIISKESIKIFNQNPLDLLNEISTERQIQLGKKNISQDYIYEFTQNIDKEIWFSLLYDILNYRKNFLQMASELINKGVVGDFTNLNNEYSKWSQKNENPLISFANFFNPILDKLNLKIAETDTQYPISIKSKINREVVPFSSLSTGTKGLLLTTFPLYEIDTTDSVILIDEPERSLFPDMQVDLIDHYKNLAPDAQLVVATHSPFIAAAFEPEERFILYFDDKGKVKLMKGKSPIGDDPNDILHNDFNVDYYNKYGKMAYEKYRNLKTKILSEENTQAKKELVVELDQLGDKYNF